MSADHPPHVYQPMALFPEYKTFVYSFDFLTPLTLLTLVLFVPSCIFTYKMLVFYIKKGSSNSPNSIHPHVFKSFLLMQCFNLVYTILDFLLIRIPMTTLATSFCASLEPGNIMPFFVAGLYFSYYTSQLFTVLFCLLRLIILYSPTSHSQISRVRSLIIVVWPIATYFVSAIVAFPNTINEVVCLQLDTPFQYGATTISTRFVTGNKYLSWGNLLFSTSVILAVVFSTSLMLMKLRKRKILRSSSRPFQKTKSETTLTVTMFLILIPLISTLFISIASLTGSPYYSYILVARPVFIDTRVNIVSCYFYLTHPVFKKKTTRTSVAVLNSSNTT